MGHGKKGHVASCGDEIGFWLDQHHVGPRQTIQKGIDVAKAFSSFRPRSGGHEAHDRVPGQQAGKLHARVAGNADEADPNDVVHAHYLSFLITYFIRSSYKRPSSRRDSS